jgi:hypothetical protein
VVALDAQEVSFGFCFRQSVRAVQGGRVLPKVGVGPGPETFTEADTHRIDEWLVRVSYEQLLKEVHVYGADYFEEVRIFNNGVTGNVVGELRRWGAREGRV